MQLNIFSVLADEVPELQAKLRSVKMVVINDVSQDGWQGMFYYSPDDDPPRQVQWAEPFKDYFANPPIGQSPFAVFVFKKADRCYALSYGKAHFHVRPFCNYDFGIELAKRIAREDEVRQTASKRFGGRQNKAIRSYSLATRLSVQSGESVDLVQASVLPSHVAEFGKVGKFGTSAMVWPDITADGIGTFLNKVEAELGNPPKFDVPRTVRLTDEQEIKRYDELLLDVLQGASGAADFAHNTFDLYGVDFVFATAGSYAIKFRTRKPLVLEQLTIEALQNFIVEQAIPREQIFKIKVAHIDGDGNSRVSDLKRELDFIADPERVLLDKGRWMTFNQDYLNYLDEYLRGILVEETEPQFSEIPIIEGDFNASKAIKEAGYEVADKNFKIFKTRSRTPIEAWDLKRGNTVYAVKFGTAQKLGYVCDQAIAVLELMRNKAEVKEIPEFDRYCLWLGYKASRFPESITRTGSIILKQKIEAWARMAEDRGVTPVLKLSRYNPPPADHPSQRKAAKRSRTARRKADPR